MTDMHELIEAIAELNKAMKKLESPWQKEWVDSQMVCQMLNISKRTLQGHRDSKLIPYSRMKGKFYYKVEDIRSLLEENYTDRQTETDKSILRKAS